MPRFRSLVPVTYLLLAVAAPILMLGFAAPVLMLTGCASSTTKIRPSELGEVKKGQTTLAEVSRQFGRPNFLSKNWDGTRTAVYAYSEGWSDAAIVLPAMGAIAGVGGVESVTFYFDSKGVLADYTVREAPAAKVNRAGTVNTIAHAAAQNGNKEPDPTIPKNKDQSGLPSWLPAHTRDLRQ